MKKTTQQSNFCMWCGTPLHKGTAFCGECGSLVKPPESGPQPPASARDIKLKKKDNSFLIGAIIAVIIIVFLVLVLLFPEFWKTLGYLILVLCVLVLLSNWHGSTTTEHKINGKTYIITGTHADRERAASELGYCNGDCEHCPPHYGNRYGRRYYGKGHSSGCERGGNGGPGRHREV